MKKIGTFVFLLILLVIVSGCGSKNVEKIYTGLVYLSDASTSYGSIWEMNEDGTGTKEIVTNSSSNIWMAYPVLSADRTKLAYCTSNGKIYLVDAEKGVPQDLSVTCYQAEIALSPDGKRVAYFYNNNIYVKTIGGEELQLTNCTTGYDLSPTWSPDGQRIAFIHKNSTTGCVIYVTTADEEGAAAPYATIVNNFAGADSCGGLAWSPNGDKIAVNCFVNGEHPHQIYIMDINTTTYICAATKRLTNSNNLTYEAFAHWSDDGTEIFYQGNDGNIYKATLSNPPGAGQRITDYATTGHISDFSQLD